MAVGFKQTYSKFRPFSGWIVWTDFLFPVLNLGLKSDVVVSFYLKNSHY